MFAIFKENTISNVISSYQHTEQELIEGSDEHLDFILETNNIKSKLDQATNLTRILVEAIEQNFNYITVDQAKEIVVQTIPCFSIANKIINRFRKSPHNKFLRNELANFNLEFNELKEFVSDLSRYKIQDNSELINLLNEEI